MHNSQLTNLTNLTTQISQLKSHNSQISHRKDIEGHHRFEVGDEIREQARHDHHAQSLQHAAPVRHHHLALAAIDPRLQRDQRRIHSDGIGQEANQRKTDRRDDVEPRIRWNVRENEVLDALYTSEPRGNGETGVVRVEDNAADGEEDVDDAGDKQRDDEGVLEARRVLHAGLAVREGEDGLRGTTN